MTKPQKRELSPRERKLLWPFLLSELAPLPHAELRKLARHYLFQEPEPVATHIKPDLKSIRQNAKALMVIAYHLAPAEPALQTIQAVGKLTIHLKRACRNVRLAYFCLIAFNTIPRYFRARTQYALPTVAGCYYLIAHTVLRLFKELDHSGYTDLEQILWPLDPDPLPEIPA